MKTPSARLPFSVSGALVAFLLISHFTIALAQNNPPIPPNQPVPPALPNLPDLDTAPQPALPIPQPAPPRRPQETPPASENDDERENGASKIEGEERENEDRDSEDKERESREEDDENTTTAAATPAPPAATTSSSFRTVATNAPILTETPSPAASPATRSRATFRLTDLPTIAGVGVPSQVVPHTASAPYMQKSSLPDGTVFICVGAALGFFGACVLAWRGLVAWSLHRSVRTAASLHTNHNGSGGDSKPVLRQQMAGVYGPGPGFSHSLDRLTGCKASVSKTDLRTSVAPISRGSLFFSPTAASLQQPQPHYQNQHYNHMSTSSASAAATALGMTANRSSNYLPAGYYPPGSTIPPPTGVSSGRSGSMTGSIGLGYDAGGGSPGGYPRMSMFGLASTSSLHLPPTGRAPSAYLEDLFESHGNISPGSTGGERV